jgi:hypothetical protein
MVLWMDGRVVGESLRFCFVLRRRVRIGFGPMAAA